MPFFSNPANMAHSSIIQNVQNLSITDYDGSRSIYSDASFSKIDLNYTLVMPIGFNVSGFTNSLYSIYYTGIASLFSFGSEQVISLSSTTDDNYFHTFNLTIAQFKKHAITSIQYGSVVINAASSSNTATIAAVTTARSAVVWLGSKTNTPALANADSAGILTLTNTTTVTASRQSTSNSLTVYFAVVQFAASVIQSIQEVTTTVADGSTTANSTISSVTVANCMCLFGGWKSGSTSSGSLFRPLAFLAGATTVTAEKVQTGGGSSIVMINVIEFKSSIIKKRNASQPTMASAITVTSAVQAGNNDKMLPVHLGNSLDASPTGGYLDAEGFTSLDFSDTTHVRASRGTGLTSANITKTSIEVIEFY